MKYTLLHSEIILSSLLLLSLFFLFDPLHLLMLSMLQMLLLCVIAVIFSVYAIFLFRERVSDERESIHRFIGNRFGYLAGSSILTIAIIWEKLAHRPIGWLLLALAVMVIGKLFGLLWARYTH